MFKLLQVYILLILFDFHKDIIELRGIYNQGIYLNGKVLRKNVRMLMFYCILKNK